MLHEVPSATPPSCFIANFLCAEATCVHGVQALRLQAAGVKHNSPLASRGPGVADEGPSRHKRPRDVDRCSKLNNNEEVVEVRAASTPAQQQRGEDR